MKSSTSFASYFRSIFLSPRTVPEVCGYSSESIDDTEIGIGVTIIGYRNEFTNEPEILRNIAAVTVHKLLSREALARSKTRMLLTVRPWNNLVLDWSNSP